MMIQYLLIGGLFAGALFYLFRLFRRQFGTSDKGCSKGCGCDTEKTNA